MAYRLGLFSLILPLIYYYFTLFLPYPEQGSLLDDWFVFLFSITLLLYGYLLGGSDRFWEHCEKYRFIYAGTALVCIILLYNNYWWNMEMPQMQGNSLYEYGILNATQIWVLILSLLGFAKKYLNFSNRFLKYANEAVYPFYILHQTLIVGFGYYIVQWTIPIFLKLLILIVSCFLSLYLLYNWLIKPFVVTRFLYGLKLKRKND